MTKDQRMYGQNIMYFFHSEHGKNWSKIEQNQKNKQTEALLQDLKIEDMWLVFSNIGGTS